MGFWGRIFGSSKVQDGFYHGIDKAIFTSEEKSDFKLSLLKAFEPFKLLQRLMVLLFCIPFVFLHCVVIIGVMAGHGWGGLSDMINNAFGYPVSAAVTLYLTGGVLEGGFKAFNNKK